MDYSKSGVIARRRQLNSYGGKIVRKLILLLVKVAIAAFIGVGVCLAAGGIGLFRSEFLYLESEDYPTEEQQFTAYRKVLLNFAEE